MALTWLRRRLRGTLLHRHYRRVVDHLAGSRATPFSDLNAAYDRQTVEVMRCVLRHDSSCVDTGAHRGDILEHIVAIAPAGTLRVRGSASPRCGSTGPAPQCP